MSQLVQFRLIYPPTTELLHVPLSLPDRWSLQSSIHYLQCLNHESTICQISSHNHFFHMFSTVFTVFNSTEKKNVFYCKGDNCQWQRIYLKKLWRFYQMISDFSMFINQIFFFLSLAIFIYGVLLEIITHTSNIYLFLILVLVFMQLLRISRFITEFHDIKFSNLHLYSLWQLKAHSYQWLCISNCLSYNLFDICRKWLYIISFEMRGGCE